MTPRKGTRIFLAIVLTVALTPMAFAEEEKQPSDTRVTNAIEREYLLDPAVSLDDITVRTTSGIVELTGTVDNLLAKKRAARIAETIRGVRSVSNRLDVRSHPTLTDADIAREVTAALLGDPATESWEVDVEVNDGTVDLTGTVDSWQEKQIAGKVAMGVRGVTGVENDLFVEYGASRPDTEIEPDVEKALRWDTLVDDTLIDIAVKDGAVTLSGSVGSAAEKRRARIDAWVQGVKDVNVDGLEVHSWAKNELRREQRPTFVPKSDDEIRNAVEDAMVYDPRVLSFDIDVTVDDGIVTLNGTVDNVSARRAAEMLARHTVGVSSVLNLIRVSTEDMSDEAVESLVRSALARNPWLEDDNITVDVVNGTAWLIGDVDTWFEKEQAGTVTSRVQGVDMIRNRIDVAGSGTVFHYSPYVDVHDPWTYEWYSYVPGITFKTDSAIRRETRSGMFWSPFVDSSDVTVSVDDGTVHLTGTVQSRLEKRQAAEEAFQAGAIWVDNDLVVASNGTE